MIELERTFLAKHIPDIISHAKKKEMLDIYIPLNSPHPTLRIRKNGDKYEITKKTLTGKDHSKLSEETVALTKEEFSDLSVIKGKRVSKTRYLYEHKGRVCEIDIFEGELKGLVLIDFEFKSEDEKKKFQAPEFCLTEVTQEEFVAGGYLAGRKYKDIEKSLKKYNYKKLLL